MATEIEAKIKVDDFTAARHRLVELGGKRLHEVLETNFFFDHPDGSLRAADRGLRVRTMRNLDTGGDLAVMTCKGPRQPGELKSREELEITVNDPQTAMLLLDRLGFVRSLSFEKRRESWLMDDCRIELDELPHLGCFIEIEGPDEAAVQRTRRRLSLESTPVEMSSYASLLDQYLRDQRIDNRLIMFDGQSE